MKKKVAIGLSGGIDSSVAAFLLKKQGWDVIGFTLKFYPQENRCCDLESLYQAQRLCHKLDIAHYVFDVGKIFKKEIINYFIDTYLRGLTPNPCAYCNKLIKFGLFFQKIRSLGFKYLATGHYANISYWRGNYFFKRGRDPKKSQEYFLSLVSPDNLKYLIFPLGHYKKSKVKQIAKKENIMFKERRESQDACFINNVDYSEFIKSNLTDDNEYYGNIRHIDGKILGRHKGIYYYTYGQRSGLGISWEKPLYVVKIDKKTKEIIVAEKELLKKSVFKVGCLNWFIPKPKKISNLRGLAVKVRYNSITTPCTLNFSKEDITVILKDEVDSIAPGQIAAFYYKDLLLGGGVITGN
ncbi:MAG: tRNA 2-thiouridine(34) synthase MnmA [Candidatus Omnitrophica bacterium]|jgi:tRNA-specific 2-thiouridylase|nr:tRNA 2-thiouridine(34) synthase MnmA [Candidatus Omnitrophota bacterium]